MPDLAEWIRAPSVQLLLACAAFGGVGWLAQAIAFRVALRWVPQPSLAALLIEAARPPARIVLPLVAMQVPLAQGASLPGVAIAMHASRIVLIAALCWCALRAIAAVQLDVARRFPVDVVDNLHARRIRTQAQLLSRTASVIVLLVGTAIALMTFPGVRSIGASLLASAGLAGIVVGFAAKPVLSNVIAGLQIALTQPIRIDDVLVVEGEFGRVEEITGSFVVLRVWDQRRLIVPLQYFIDHPVANWTRSESALLGTVYLWADFDVDIDAVRAEVARACEASSNWDGRTAGLVVTDCSERAMQLRALVSATDSGKLWDLRCEVREALLRFLRDADRRGLPRVRVDAGEMPRPDGDARRPDGTRPDMPRRQ